MDAKDFPSSSDESDVDFVPEEEVSNSGSESEVTDNESPKNENRKGRARKKTKINKKNNKRLKTEINEEEVKDGNDESEKKIDVDALWADFKKDVERKEAKKTVLSSNIKSDEDSLTKKINSNLTSEKNISETSKVKLPSSFSSKPKVGGLSNVLNLIGKKDKMSTLQKSQLDWNNFKKSEGIEEEIKLHNKGKDGYLDKQDFLQRTDLRQFEIEKDLRKAHRKF